MVADRLCAAAVRPCGTYEGTYIGAAIVAAFDGLFL